jgi:hypothetical protein
VGDDHRITESLVQRFLDLEAVVPGAKVRYGRADARRPYWEEIPGGEKPVDKHLFEKSKAPQPGPMPPEVWDAYNEIMYRNLTER